MSNTPQPKLRTKPPLSDAAAAMRRLEALDEWTEKPARDAAAALVKAPESDSVEPKPKARKPKAAPKKPVEAKEEGAPWDSVKAGEGTLQAASFRIPVDLYKKLVWVAETTYGYNQTKIVAEALAEKLDKLLEAKGIKQRP